MWNHGNKELSLAGVDFFVQQNLQSKGNKIKCMLCLSYVSSTGVIKHTSSLSHRSNYIRACFPTTFSYLIELEKKSLDDVDFQIISKSLINALGSMICVEIVRHYPDKFIPWVANNLENKEFNSVALETYINNKINHVNERDFPETKKIINSTIERFMKKSKECLEKIGFGSNEKLEVKSSGDSREEAHSVPRKRLKRNFSPQVSIVEQQQQREIDKPTLTETEMKLEMDRMRVAINIALEVFTKGLTISPAQLEESVSAFYKHEFVKSMSQENTEIFEALTKDDVNLLIENFDHLTESEQKNFAKYLNMLRRINHQIINDLRADKSSCESFIKIISYDV